MINAIQTFKTITSWIASADKEVQLDVLTLFITDTFSKRFPIEVNKLHQQMVEDMLQSIEVQRDRIGRCENLGTVHTMD